MAICEHKNNSIERFVSRCLIRQQKIDRWAEIPMEPRNRVAKMPEVRKSVIEEDGPEVKNEVAVNTVNINQVENSTGQLIAYFSDWLALKKYVA